MSTPAPVITARGPGDLAALVPQLVGFAPTESLVAISLRGPRQRVGLTLRADLGDLPALVPFVVEGLTRDGARSAVLVVHTDEPDLQALPWSELVDEVDDALAGRGIEVTEALLVRAGSWWSYRCRASCCPPSGTPLDLESPVVLAAASEHAYDGRAVLASREELVASVQARPPLGPALARRLQEQAVQDLERRLAGGLTGPVRGEAVRAGVVRADVVRAEVVQIEVQRWRAALDAWSDRPNGLPPADVAALAVALHLIEVRDTVACWGATRSEALLGLLSQLVTGVVAPHDAPVCAVLGWQAYGCGNGALALVALQRALATDPAYSLAQLLLAMLDGLVPPQEVRRVLRTAAPLPAGRAGRRRRR